MRTATTYFACFCVLVSLDSLAIAGDPPSVPSDALTVIPLLINVTEGVDSSNIDEAIERMNKIYEKAGIAFAVTKVVRPYKPAGGDNDPNLTDAEGNEAQKEGQKELREVMDKVPEYKGKGVKITMAKDVWVESPSTMGWARHGNPVVFVEPDSDANELGNTMAHELGHVLTLNYDLKDASDPNLRKRLMWGYDNRTDTGLTPAEVNEVRKGATGRGVILTPMPEWASDLFTIGSGKKTRRTGNASQFNGYGNMIVIGGSMDPNDPVYASADIISASVACYGPTQDLLVNIQLGGLLPESFFDITYEVLFDFDGNPATPDLVGMIHVMPGPMAEMTFASLPPLPVTIHTNKLFKSVGGVDADNSMEVRLPREYLATYCDPFTGSFMVKVNSNGTMICEGMPVNLMDFSGPWFEYSNPVVRSGGELHFGARSGGGDPVYIVAGCGFMTAAVVRVDDIVAGIAAPDPTGCFTMEIPPVLTNSPGVHRVVAVAEGMEACATGFFTTVEPLDGDINGDGRVDMLDFARLASNWLVGAG